MVDTENGSDGGSRASSPNKRSWALTRSASVYETELQSHNQKERATVRLTTKVGELLYERGVELVFFRKHLVDAATSEVLQLHEYGSRVVRKPVSVHTTAAVAEALCELDLGPAKLDVGLLAYEWEAQSAGEGALDKAAFLKEKLSTFTVEQQMPFAPRDVVLFGFGRIGRLLARELIKSAGKGQQLRLRAIVTRDKNKEDILKRAALLSNDSVHGAFKGSVEVDVENQSLCINGQVVKLISARQPEDVDYTEFGIQDALVVDNTGAFRNREELSRHLKAKGVAKVLLTAPGGEVPNVVYGINHNELDLDGENIFSAASCTTNAISPILSVVHESVGIEAGHVETIHSYTNDQNLLDNFHKKNRRGRSAAVNMVITETGAAKAVKKVIPSLGGKLTANAVRVPTPNASLAILNLYLEQPRTAEEINELVRVASVTSGTVAADVACAERGTACDVVNQIHYNDNAELVSSDCIGNACPAIFDSTATKQGVKSNNVLLYVFYDNEFGYSKQVIRLAKHICKVRRKIYQ